MAISSTMILNVLAQTKAAQRSLNSLNASVRSVGTSASMSDKVAAASARARAASDVASAKKRELADARAAAVSENAKVQQIRSDQRAANSAAKAAEKRAAAAHLAAQSEELGAKRTEAALARSNLAAHKSATAQEAAAAKLGALQTASATTVQNVTARVQAAYAQRAIAAQKAAVAEARAAVISSAGNARAIVSANQLANAKARAAGKTVSAVTRAAQTEAVINARKLTDDARRMASGSAVTLKQMQDDARSTSSALKNSEALAARDARAVAGDERRAAAARVAMTQIETAMLQEAATAATTAAQQLRSDQLRANAAMKRAGEIVTAERVEAQARQLGAAQALAANARIAVSDAQRASLAAAADSRDAQSALRAAMANERAANQQIAANRRLQASNAATAASSNTMFSTMAKNGSKMQWIGRQLTSNISMPILALSGIGVAMGLSLEKAMTRVTKVYGDSARGAAYYKEEIKALEKAFIALSNQYGVQSDEVANIAADWAAAGSSGLALAKQTELTMKTMVLGEMDAKAATEALIAIQAQWGAVTEDNIDKLNEQGVATQRTTEDNVSLTGILRQLNAVENETGTKMSDLVDAYSRSSSMARTAGVSTGELAAMVSALVPAAGNAATAGNGLKTMLSRIMAPTSAATEIMGEMGINLDKQGWASMTATQRMETLAESYQGLTGEQKALVDANVAGRYQLNRFGAMMESMANPVGYYRKSLELLSDQAKVTRIAEQELQAVLDSNPQKAKQAGTIIQNSLITAMQPLIPLFIQASQWIAKVFKAFADLSPQVRTTVFAILLILSVLGPLILLMGLTKLAISQLAPMFLFLGRMILLPLAPLKLLGAAFMMLPKVLLLAGKGMVLAGGAVMKILVGVLGAMQVATAAGMAAWRAIMGAGFAALVISSYVAAGALKAAWLAYWATHSAIQIAGHVGSLLLYHGFWTAWALIQKTGQIVSLASLKKFGKALLTAFASPWVLAIATVTFLLVAFKDQISKAISNVIDYFKNMPAGIKKGLAPIGNMFVAIGNLIRRVFNMLPESIKNALLAVVRIIHVAAMKIYELFSYINPFARHSPSLVENVTAGMAAVNAQFTNSAAVAQNSIKKMHQAINSLRGASAAIVAENTKADDQKMRDTAVKAGQGSALPAYDNVKNEVDSAQGALESLNGTIQRQTALVNRLQSGVDAYDKKIEQLNRSLDTTKAIQDSVNAALGRAQAKYDKFAAAQVMGMQDAEDATFANEQAQKRLQLQMKKLEAESGSVDSITDAYSRLQGEIELLMGKQAELRNAGAGSDILGPYDKMISDLKAKQAGLGSTTNSGPAAEIAKLNTELEKLQRQAEIMDLEKSLKFDGLNRNIEKFKSNVQEMPYGEIMNGLDSSRTSVNSLQYAYDTLGQVMDGQQMQIDAVTKSRDELSRKYDLENEKLEGLNESYSQIEQTIQDGKQAMDDFASASEAAIQRQEAALQAAEEALEGPGGKAAKDAAGGGGGGASDIAEDFAAAGSGDFDTYGGKNIIGREGGDLLQTGEIEDFTAGLVGDLEKQLGSMNPFKPLQDAWNRMVDWFGQNVAPLGAPISAMFGDLGDEIASAFSPEQADNAGAFGKAVQGTINFFKKLGHWIKVSWDFLAEMFGPDLRTTIKELGDGLVGIWTDASGPLGDFVKTLKPLGESLLPVLILAIGLTIATVEVLWEILNGLLGPVFSFIGDVIASVIKIFTGLINIFTGALDFLTSFAKILIGVFTLDGDMILDGFKQLADGIRRMMYGIWQIIDGIWQTIASLFVNMGKAIWNTVWGFIKGIIDFFYQLWDTLVGHSIVPDTVNSIVDWFTSLPGKVLGLIWQFIQDVAGFFLELPNKVGEALPGVVTKLRDFFVGLPGKVWESVSTAGSKLGGQVVTKIKEGIGSAPGLSLSIGTKIVSSLASAAETVGTSVLEFGKQIPGWIVSGIMSAPGTAMNIITWFLGVLGQLPGAIWNFITTTDWVGIFSGIWTWVSDPANLEKIGKVGATIVATIVGAVLLAALGIPLIMLGIGLTIAYGLAKAMAEQTMSIKNTFANWFQQGFQYVVDNIDNWIIGLIMWFGSLPGKLIAALGNLGTLVLSWVQAGWNWVVKNGGIILLGVISYFTGIPAKLLAALGDLGKILFEAGQKIIEGLIDGFKDKFEGVKNTLTDLGENLIPDWKGPAERDKEILVPAGQMLIGGLIDGLESKYPDVEASLGNLTDSVGNTQLNVPQIAAIADTSSVDGAVAQLDAAAAGGGSMASATMGATAVAAPDTAALTEATAELDAFVADSTAKLTGFNVFIDTSVSMMIAGITLQFATMQVLAQASFAQMTIDANVNFTQMQALVVAIVVAMVTEVGVQLQALLQLIVAFGANFNTAWKAAWEAFMLQTTTGTDHTLSEWDRMAQGMTDTLETGIRPVFDSLAEMLTQAETNFATTVGNISTAWAGVKEATAAPVRFTIQDVYNGGLLGVWNGVADLIGGAKMNPFPLNFKTGGPVNGPGTETSDSIPAMLSKKEYVLSADAVKRAGGVNNLNRFNFGNSTPQGMFNIGGDYKVHLATGGPADPGSPAWTALQRGHMFARQISPGPYGLGGSSGGARAGYTDCSGFQSEIADVIMGGRGGSRKWATGSFPGGGGSQGKAVTIGNQLWLAGLGAGHSIGISVPHAAGTLGGVPGLPTINIESGGGTGQGATYGAPATGADDPQFPTQYHLAVVDGMFVSGGGAAGASMVDILNGMIDPGLNSMLEKAKAYPGKGFAGSVPLKVAESWNNQTRKHVEAKARELDARGPSIAAGEDMVERWRPMVIAALKRNGFEGNKREQDLMLAQIRSESSGNPAAIQTVQDVNSGGNEAAGLLQIAKGTWPGVRDPSLPDDRLDPWANMNAALRYYRRTYGDDLGTHWGQGHGYDNGGMLAKGLQVTHNQTGGPEPVLTQTQWNAMYKLSDSANVLTPEDVEDAMIDALTMTGNTANTQANAIIKGMDVWQKAWTPAMYDSTDKMTDAANANTKATQTQAGSNVLLSGSIGKFNEQIKSFSAMMVAISNTAASGESLTFANVSPILNAVGDFIDTLPYAERDWAADNPRPGETEQQRKIRVAQNNLTNFAKGSFNVVKDMAPVLLKHTGIIGTAVEKLVTEDGAAWATAIGLLSTGNPMGAITLIPLILKAIFTILPLIIAAIMDIVPSLIRAIVRFLTQFMPDSVFAYADMAAAEEAVKNQQGGGETAQGQGQRYPTDAMSTSSGGNAPVNLYIYGDLSMPNVTNGDDAQDLIDNLTLLAGN